MSDKTSKIIDITSANQRPPPLTPQQIQHIGAAYARLLELREQKVLTVNTETEVKGLLEFLSSELITHTDELLACWLVARTEYEPLLNIFARITGRVAGKLSQRVQPAPVDPAPVGRG